MPVQPPPPAKGISSRSPESALEPWDAETKDLNVIIDTPKHSRNKYKYDPERELFKLSGILPAGAVFPFDFGYVPGTLGEDGDPLDVLLLMDEPAFAGCLVPARLIGVIRAEQTEFGKTSENDRLIAVASVSRTHEEIVSLEMLSDNLLQEIEHFFISYNEIKGKEFTPKGRGGPEEAVRLIEEGQQKQREHAGGSEPRQKAANGKNGAENGAKSKAGTARKRTGK